MSLILQDKRILQIQVPFDPQCVLLEISGEESLSDLFRYKCETLSHMLHLDAKELIGKIVSVKIMKRIEDGSLELVRFVNGMIKSVTAGNIRKYKLGEISSNMRQYSLELVPKLFVLQKTSHCRVFQNKEQHITTIVESILKKYGITYDMGKVSKKIKKPYSMQYNESDLRFLQRLLSDAGIYFYFKHTADQHVLILADQAAGYLSDKVVSYTFKSNDSYFDDLEHLSIATNLSNEKFATNDYLLENPNQKLYSAVSVKKSTNDASLDNKRISFTYPGSVDSSSMAQDKLKLMVEAEEANIEIYTCALPQIFELGRVVTLSGNYFTEKEKKVVVTQLKILVQDEFGVLGDQSYQATSHTNGSVFSAIDSTLTWRPKNIVPQNPGPQIAVVVNAKGETDANQPHYFDELGRVCVKFVWEAYQDEDLHPNKFDQCITSALHSWDNGVYRVGTPVVVDFINNDLDRPMIVGTINHANNLLLSKFSNDNVTQSIIQRMPGVDKHEYNSIKFDDKKDKQILTITAIDQLVTTSKSDLITSAIHEENVGEMYNLTTKASVIKNETYTQEVSEAYNLKSADLLINSKTCKQVVEGEHNLQAKEFVITGDIVLTGNLKIKGKVEVS